MSPTTKTKVCILQNGLALGGTDTFVVNLCKRLDHNKYVIDVVNPSTKEGSMVREPELLSSGVTILRTHPLSGLLGRLRHLIALYKILRRGHYDVFQTNVDLFNGPNLLVAWLARIPVRCCHSHNSMQQRALVKGMTLPIRIYQSVMKWMCWHFANRHCGCSEMAMDFLYAGHDWNALPNCYVINNGIDLAKFRMGVDVTRKKKELGLSPGKHVIVTVGRIIPQKNPLFLAEVFCKIAEIRHDCELLWVGVGSLQEQCQELFHKHGITDLVYFLGSRSDVNEILPCCDVFLLPSAFEGLAIVLLEAQASGLMCLVSTTTTPNANCGLCKYKPLEDGAASWAQAISDMIDHKVDMKIDEERLNKFSIEYMARQMQEVFDNKD